LTRVGGDARKPPDVTKKPLLFSGGAGLVASAADYPHFAQMLLNEGEYGNVRLLAPHTVRLMTSNALPPDVGYADIARRMGDIGPTRRWIRGLASALRAVLRRAVLARPWMPAFAMNASTSTCTGACQWHGGSLKYGGAITMSAAPNQPRRSGPQRACSSVLTGSQLEQNSGYE